MAALALAADHHRWCAEIIMQAIEAIRTVTASNIAARRPAADAWVGRTNLARLRGLHIDNLCEACEMIMQSTAASRGQAVQGCRRHLGQR
ncbi:hypothetical protein AGRA3207_007337 [Actinomadura graeca]|uniref:Uncharacterized protein n=1 Tax=Actinomadura graeca TaxID=2750812 RepID=A0ABX8R408_9ACTN|nr:hypothetical protein [Actinomadura graeca]QXJ25787.1 hypothetical protein AGRA3207_007337 [Actinomadura graeca]